MYKYQLNALSQRSPAERKGKGKAKGTLLIAQDRA